jgi:hypothetical protein
MRVPPLAAGAGAGLLLVLALAPSTGTALGKLSAARTERTRLAAVADAPERPRPPLVTPGFAAGKDSALLAARIRGRAHDAGVLVEQVALGRGGGALMRLRLSFSGSEKAVVALADALEREAVLIRFESWKLAPVEGGVRLTGQALAVRQ